MDFSQPQFVTLNRHWAFRYFVSPEETDSRAKPGYDDTDWAPVALPHTWSTYETTGELHPFIKQPSERDSELWWYGWGWYRKKISIAEALRGKKLFLEFDGAMKYAKVWLNGQYIGDHKGGYTSFSLDITEAVRYGEDNVLAVAVSSRRNDEHRIPPMTAGNFNVYGGIYRDVRLVVKDLVHIPFQGSADHEGGTFVTTPAVSETEATVHIRTFVKNEYGESRIVTVTNRLLDPEDRLLRTSETTETLPAGETRAFDQKIVPIEEPRLWSPESPSLYRVVTEVELDGKAVDHYESPLGFRWFEWNYDKKRLILNGQEVHLHGTNRHQEYPWLGDAIPKWMHDMDLHDIKYGQGHNFLRTCHYTQDKAVYDWCDRHGILVCEEVPNIKNIDFSDEVQENHVREMIRRDRNHPSIIMWSMGNETNHAADPSWARREDETRIIHYRHVAGRGADEPHNDKQIDMENCLRCTVRGWLNTDVRDLEPPIGQHTGHEKWQHDMALVEGASQRGRIDTNGAMWIYADHGCDREYVYAPLKHVNPKGWVDAYRVPKLMYYLWQANWTTELMVYVHPYEWSERYLGQARDITVNSNCETVELFVGSRSLGILRPGTDNDRTVVFPGIQVVRETLSAVGRTGGREVRMDVPLPGAPAKLSAKTEQPIVEAGRAGIALVRIDITDAAGNHIYGAAHPLDFSIEGPASLVSPQRYESDIAKEEELEGSMYIDAPVYAVVRTTDAPGRIVFTVRSPGLETASVVIESVEAQEAPVTGIAELPVRASAGSSPYDPAEVEAFRQREFKAPEESSKAMQLTPTKEDVNFSGTDPAQYAYRMNNLIRKETPGLTSYTRAYGLLIDLMVEQLNKDNGIIVADDYNFNIARFNDCSRITAVIEDLGLPQARKKELQEEYARRMITRGELLDPDIETARLRELGFKA